MISASILILILTTHLQQDQILCELIKTPKETLNSINNDIPTNKESTRSAREAIMSIPKSNDDDFSSENTGDGDDIAVLPNEKSLNEDAPISDIDIDYLRNAIILQFRKNFLNPNKGKNWDSSSPGVLDQNFMRFGRAENNNLMRFGKRQLESTNDQQPMNEKGAGNRMERSSGTSSRDSRGDNFMRFGRAADNLMRFGRASDNLMRFGRASDNLMRFGRASDNLMRFGRSSENLVRFGRAPPNNLMRFGRAPPNNLMRFGRAPPNNLMRFGRAPPNNLMRFGRSNGGVMRFGRSNGGVMRFGRSDPNLMRFGRADGSLIGRSVSRPDNFIRFGRNQDNLMRFGRNDRNFMRFGKLDQNFMRFGKRDEASNGNHLDYDQNNNKTEEKISNDLDSLFRIASEPEVGENYENFNVDRSLNNYDYDGNDEISDIYNHSTI